MAISLTKEKMEELFLQYLATIFGFPEVVSCCRNGRTISSVSGNDLRIS